MKNKIKMNRNKINLIHSSRVAKTIIVLILMTITLFNNNIKAACNAKDGREIKELGLMHLIENMYEDCYPLGTVDNNLSSIGRVYNTTDIKFLSKKEERCKNDKIVWIFTELNCRFYKDPYYKYRTISSVSTSGNQFTISSPIIAIIQEHEKVHIKIDTEAINKINLHITDYFQDKCYDTEEEADLDLDIYAMHADQYYTTVRYKSAAHAHSHFSNQQKFYRTTTSYKLYTPPVYWYTGNYTTPNFNY